MRAKTNETEVHRVLDGGRCRRAFARPAMTFAHWFQEDRFVATVMDETWIRDRHKKGKEFVPYLLSPSSSSAQKPY